MDKIKYSGYLVLMIIISCNSQQPKNIKSDTTSSDTLTDIRTQSTNERCWVGTLNGRTHIFIHYQIDSGLIIGEITYLNTKAKLPIKLLGTIEEDKTYRLLEFDDTGNITGVITGIPATNNFNGSWFSPKTKMEFVMSLLPKDTAIHSPDIKPDEKQIFGDYHYQYGENGYSGDFEINKTGKGQIDFHILSLTNIERGPNIAEVEKDTIKMTGSRFIYKIPGSENCAFTAVFYRDFVYIKYSTGYCESQFGLNATIDGIYLKTN